MPLYLSQTHTRKHTVKIFTFPFIVYLIVMIAVAFPCFVPTIVVLHVQLNVPQGSLFYSIIYLLFRSPRPFL